MRDYRYFAVSRSNLFRVKDQNAFKQFCVRAGMVMMSSNDNPDLVGFIEDPNGDDMNGGIPTDMYNSEIGDWEQVDFAPLLARHLAEGEVAVYIEVGSERLRRLVGRAVAVNSKGDTQVIDLNDIHQIALQLGTPTVDFRNMTFTGSIA